MSIYENACWHLWNTCPHEFLARSINSSNSNDAPAFWPSYMKGYATGEECCLGYYGEGNACEIVDTCDEVKTTSTETPTTTELIKPVKWWYDKDDSLPGGGQCKYSNEYDDIFIEHFSHFLYDSKDGCCANHKDISCIPTFAPVAKPTSHPTVSNVPKWYYDPTVSTDCIQGSEYPEWMAAGTNAAKFLFDTKEACCVVNKCVVNVPKYWPQVDDTTMSIVCLQDTNYPPEFVDHSDTLFDTEEECCAVYCKDAATTAATSNPDPSTTDATDVMQVNSNGVNDETRVPSYNPTMSPDDDDIIFPKYPMFSGPCVSDDQCQDGLVCHVNSKKCICNTDTNEGCSNGAICGVAPNIFCPATGCLPTCHCDMNNDVGGTNGCKSGQVCREPCMIADAGPMCFDDEKKRDCADVGINMVCKVNRDGFVGGGCVQQVDHMMPNLEGVGCSKGFCEDFDGNCQAEISCFVDPCDNTSCDAGQVCESNYCGGCSARCVDTGLTENSAPLPPMTDCPRGECHNPDGVCEAEMFCAVDPCNGHECGFGEVCQTNMCGGCHAICAVDPLYVNLPNMADPAPSGTGSKAGKSTTTSTASTSPETTDFSPGADCPEAVWHMSTHVGGAYTCTNDGVFPSAWTNIDGFLFDSAKECCEYTFGDDCIIVDNCPKVVATTVPPTTTEAQTTTTEAPQTFAASGAAPGADCPEMKWHVSTMTGGVNTCTNDNVYPPIWDEIEGYLYDSAKECCDKHHGDACEIVDHCDCPKNWHMSVTPGESQTCTNDLDFPDSWRTQPHIFIYQSAEECCQESYDEPNCNIRDVCLDCSPTWHVNPEQPGSSW